MNQPLLPRQNTIGNTVVGKGVYNKKGNGGMIKGQMPQPGITRREILKYGLYGGLSVALSGSHLLSGCGKLGHGKKPSIILITVDTLRADHLGCYGYSRNTSPNIDAFAKDALLFENCLSHAPDTRMSFASMLSGFLPHETKTTKILRPLPTGVNTIAEILRQQGYETAAVISNYVLRKGLGFEQGFMTYDDTMNQRELVRPWPERTAGPTTDRAIELLTQLHKTQLFMWIHYQDPHGPYTPPGYFAELFQTHEQSPRNIKANTSLSGCGGIPSYQRLGANRDFHYYVSQYDGEIRYQDEHFKRLIEALMRLGLYDDALIIFSSDHGEGMGEHDYFFSHGERLYSGLTHVPLIIKYGKTLTGKRTDFVQHIDIVPTILNMLDIKPDSRFRGRDLLKQYGTKKEIFAEMDSPLIKDGIKFSIVLDGLKLIYTPLYQQYELFELETDPYEEYNLINDQKYQGQAEDLKIRLDRIRKEDFLKIDYVKKPQKLTEDEIKNLRSLGYIQ